jgi:hypothetical protein
VTLYPAISKYAKEWEVNGEIWKLKFANSIVYGGHANWGLTDPSSYEVTICQRISRGNIFSTFWHEIDHCIEFSYDIDFSKGKKFDTHSWIHLMEEYRAQFFADNWEKLRVLFK